MDRRREPSASAPTRPHRLVRIDSSASTRPHRPRIPPPPQTRDTMATDSAMPAPGAGAPSTDRGDQGPQLEQFKYDDQIVRLFAVATIFWGLVATLVGLLVAVL